MPEYVFPISEQGLREEKNLNTISLDGLVDKIANVVENGDGTKMPSWLKKAFDTNQAQTLIAELDETDGVRRTASVEKRAKKTLPEALRDHMFKKKEDEDAKGEDDKGGEDEDSDDGDVVQGKKASARQRKIHFAHPAQLSGEAVTAAKEAGDDELANTILAARHERRVRTAQRILDQAAAHAEVQKKLAKRAEYRMTVVATAETPKQTTAAPVAKTTKTAKVQNTSNGDGFKSASALSKSEKSVLAQRYVACGFPEAYVNEILGLNKIAAELPEDFKVALKEVGASNLPDNIMRTVVASMIKEANLTEEQRKRGEDYWSKDLGYVKDWSSDLWSKAYDDDGSEDGATV